MLYEGNNETVMPALICNTDREDLARKFPLSPMSSIILKWDNNDKMWQRTDDMQLSHVTCTEGFTDFTGQYSFTVFRVDQDFYMYMERAPEANCWRQRKAMELVGKDVVHVPTGWKVAAVLAVIAVIQGLWLYF